MNIAPLATFVSTDPTQRPAFFEDEVSSPLDRTAALGDEGLEPLAQIAREMHRNLEGDGLLVSWHGGSTAPQIMFADGDCGPRSREERRMAEVSLAVAGQPVGIARSQWQVGNDAAPAALLITSIPSADGMVTITIQFKRIGTSGRLRVSEAAARLLPLIKPFFEIWALRLRAMERVKAMTSALNHTDVGIILVDSQGQITFANDVAISLLALNDGLRRRGTALFGARMADTLRLQAALGHAISPQPNYAGRPPSPVVALTRAEGRSLLVAIVSSDISADVTASSAAVIYVVDPDHDLRPVIEPACKHYRLTPVETRLACMLANGSTLAKSAQAMNVTEQTARSYLKQIFVKTETSRQAELVHMMLTSSVRIAPSNYASLGY